MNRSRLTDRFGLRVGGVAVATIVFAVGLAGPTASLPFREKDVPVARVIENVGAYVAAHPSDPDGFYFLGRAHYAALFDLEAIPVGDSTDSSLPRFPANVTGQYPSDEGATARAFDDAAKQHVFDSLKSLQQALALLPAADPRAALYLLTLGSVLETAAPFGAQLGAPPITTKLITSTRAWTAAAADAYTKAFKLRIAEDAKVTRKPLFGVRTLVAYEAGRSLLRVKPKTSLQAQINALIRKLDNKPFGAITPLVLTLALDRSLPDLLASERVVAFDLDGTGRVQRYHWLKPDTALLVWDPQRSGHITSGRQLFGTATWWMLWTDAYRALDALDDNRDGTLTGRELDGLALWFDRNQNGVSDPGEVTPIESSPVVAIATTPSAGADGVLTGPSGVTLRDGTTRPTYDWIATPV